MAQFTDSNLSNTYNSILSELAESSAYTPIALPEQTQESIADQLAAILRPQYERAIASRAASTKQQKAAIDVDAASRGMGSSTWVTDAKNRLMGAEATDIANLEGEYGSQLLSDTMNQYNNYLAQKLQLDQYNQQLAAALEGDAYSRAMNQYSSGLIEGTIPYQQQQLQWQQAQRAASGGGGGNGNTLSLDEIRALLEEMLGGDQDENGVPPVTRHGAYGGGQRDYYGDMNKVQY